MDELIMNALWRQYLDDEIKGIPSRKPREDIESDKLRKRLTDSIINYDLGIDNLICDFEGMVCWEYERTGFLNGLKVGVRLALEIFGKELTTKK